MKRTLLAGLSTLALALAAPAVADTDTDKKDKDSKRFTAERVFDIEYANDPQISPDGKTIVYVRHSMDRQTDTDRGDLWILDVASGSHRPLLIGGAPKGGPRWSPDGTRLLYSTATDDRPDLRVYFMDSRESYSLGQFYEGPSNAVWSPDGKTIAFTMFEPDDAPSFAKPMKAPEGAKWADPVRVFDDMTFRFDGQGYLKDGTQRVYTISAEGGSPRKVTSGDADLGSPAWLTNDTLLVVGNTDDGRDLDPIESEIYRLQLSDLSMTPMTTRDGPDYAPSVSPDGKTIAYLGHDDNVKSYEQTHLYLMDSDGSNQRQIAVDTDRAFTTPKWSGDSKTVYSLVENMGVLDVLATDMKGSTSSVATGIGGTSIGRPYGDGAFSVSTTRKPTFAYTAGFADKPAEIAVKQNINDARVLTDLNGDVLPYLEMATLEEIKVASSVDGREIEAWVALPPDFKADGSFPLILEIHGGPFAMYGPFFASEIQRYAAEGYVTVYVNPRGSTGYGEEFAQLIDQAYPGDDYKDLMDVVDSLVARQYASDKRLFITGGSGGGILTAWTVGKTQRFAAAATVKPVINWMTMALAADIGQFVRRHWIRADPWTDPDAFLKFSPIMLMDNVVTPTLVMVGEEDWRTPTWEAEQFYTALKMKEVDTALIRVPGSSHYIAARPSRLIAKTDNIMGWFAKYDPEKIKDKDKEEPKDE